MNSLLVKGSYSTSRILVGENFKNVWSYVPDGNVYIISDKNVMNLYGQFFKGKNIYEVDPGENSKSLMAVSDIYRWLLSCHATRNSFILGVGGGVVCDIAGFVASTYMRGVKFGFVATSLLAQVDASVGGKNGVNLDGYKNIVGTFNQPNFVICDTTMLQTLPKKELANGFAEMLKHALIADSEKFYLMEQEIDRVNGCEVELLNELVFRSVQIKADVVSADEREKGERKKLNFGHTWGHAVEKVTGFPHGYSVSIGMEFASRLSMKKGLLTRNEYLRIVNMLKNLKLPACVNADLSEIFDALTKDKKRNGDYIDFILLNGIGKAVIESITIEDLHAFVFNSVG
ncbi:MAG: 3-dehydroquinate synthase [Bacteroidales bacterium]|nr:3-dehydroquinate synthase [Bacteroidales bacterium]